MKKAGREVKFLSISENNPRNGEGTLINLKNGDILYVFTEYVGSRRDDHANARLSACVSTDGGESFGDPVPMIEKGEGVVNIMSPSLIRLKSGELGMVYLQKDAEPDGGIVCMPRFIFSSDEGKSWSESTACTSKRGYYCVINDGAIVCKSGRILVPMAYHGESHHPKFGFKSARGGSVRFAASDDNGRSWYDLSGEIVSLYLDVTGLQEPGVYEHEDGELWAWCRTSYGFQYQSHSRDGGATWSQPMPNLFFTSPDAPMRVKRVGKYTVAVFNPIPHNYFSHSREDWGAPKRTPLVFALSDDDGRSFQLPCKSSVNRELREMESMLYFIEDDMAESYCYPAITEAADGFTVGYYCSGGEGHCLTNNRLIKIYYRELEK